MENYNSLGYNNQLLKDSSDQQSLESIYNNETEELETISSINGAESSNDKTDDNQTTVPVDKLISGVFEAAEFIIGNSGRIRSGQTEWDTGNGWWIGDVDGIKKLSIGSSTGDKVTWNGSALTIVGSLSAGSISIGTSPNWFRVDTSGNTWWGAVTFVDAPASITPAGVSKFTNTTITGTITSSTITGGTISIGNSNDIFKADSNGIYLGNAVFASAPFRVSMSGTVNCSNINITGGTIQWSTVAGTTNAPANNATVGATWNSNITGQPSDSSITNPSYITSTKITATTIESPTISANDGYFSGIFKVGSSGICIDGSNKWIYSANYTAGSAGWAIKNDGSAEFQNIIARGSITATSGSISGSLVSSGISASNITTGTLYVGGSGQPGTIVLNRDGSNGFLTWTGGNKIWSDGNEYMGFDAGGGRYYFYDDGDLMALFQNGSQASFYDGVNCEGNFNVDSSYAARFEGVPVYLYSSGTNCRIQGSSTVISYEAPNDHNFYVGGTASVDAVIDANIWTNGNLYAEGTKPFLISHPDGTKGKMLRYTAQESPEVILRHRGKGKTDSNGNCIIVLPTHFTLVTEESGDVTVNLTPVGNNHIYLEEEPTNINIKVKSDNPNTGFHYEVIAVRKGYLNEKVEFNINDKNFEEKDQLVVDAIKKRNNVISEFTKK